ncbi:hypothetical protein [Sphingomicrobium arenosum]|uniref:hypothetical protein n=1 Tax=Sphingomicrobium arenosum TaxID=2233861 RepID=UPI002240FAC7|nr:hypothetical protein [Sphingomicrobium arenosum]
MTDLSLSGDDRLLKILRIIAWSLVAVLLALPAIAMAGGAEVQWGPEDFIAATLLLGGSGLVVELLVRVSRDWNYRIAAVLATFGALFTLWANLAVGIVGNEDNAINIGYYLIVPLLALGATLARLKPAGMAATCRTAATLYIGMGIAAFAAGQGEPAPFIIGIHALFVTIFMGAGQLFQRATGR